MAYGNGIITSPVSIYDVQQALGNSSPDLGTLCKASQINKWAKYKPEGGLTHVGLTTLAMRRGNNMGLSPVAITKLKQSTYPYGSQSYGVDAVRAEVQEWSYKARTVYRLHDFANCDGATGSQGYNHNAKPCDSDWTDISITKSHLQEIIDNTNVTGRFLNFSVSLTNASSGYINGANDSNLPLSWIGNDTFNSYYLCLAVYVPYNIGGVALNKWLIIAPADILANCSASNTNIMPDLQYNRWLCKALIQSFNNGVKSFECVPCLVSNLTKGTQDGYSFVFIYQTGVVDASVYCMPSGTNAFKLNVIDTDVLPTVTICGQSCTAIMNVGPITTTTNMKKGWFLFEFATGNVQVGYHSYQHKQILLLYVGINTSTGVTSFVSNPATTFNGVLSYSYISDPASATSATNTTTVSPITAGQTADITKDGVSTTVYGAAIVTTLEAKVRVNDTTLST